MKQGGCAVRLKVFRECGLHKTKITLTVSISKTIRTCLSMYLSVGLLFVSTLRFREIISKCYSTGPVAEHSLNRQEMLVINRATAQNLPVSPIPLTWNDIQEQLCELSGLWIRVVGHLPPRPSYPGIASTWVRPRPQSLLLRIKKVDIHTKVKLCMLRLWMRSQTLVSVSIVSRMHLLTPWQKSFGTSKATAFSPCVSFMNFRSHITAVTFMKSSNQESLVTTSSLM